MSLHQSHLFQSNTHLYKPHTHTCIQTQTHVPQNIIKYGQTYTSASKIHKFAFMLYCCLFLNIYKIKKHIIKCLYKLYIMFFIHYFTKIYIDIHYVCV